MELTCNVTINAQLNKGVNTGFILFGLNKIVDKNIYEIALTSMAPQLLDSKHWRSNIRVRFKLIFFSETPQLNYPITWKYFLFQYWLPYSVLTHLSVLVGIHSIYTKKRFILRGTRSVSLAKSKFKLNKNKCVDTKKCPGFNKIAAFVCVNKKINKLCGS